MYYCKRMEKKNNNNTERKKVMRITPYNYTAVVFRAGGRVRQNCLDKLTILDIIIHVYRCRVLPYSAQCTMQLR